MTPSEKKELEIALTSYIALKHTQEECIGFIDGFKEAVKLFSQEKNFVCGRNITSCVFYKEGGKCGNLEYCRDQKPD